MFYTMINDRAKANYTGPPLTDKNYEEFWFPAWFGAAEAIRDEFLAEGLTKSATAIQDIIDLSRKITGYK